MKIGALVLCHEDIMNLQFGLIKNHRVQMASVQSGLLRFCKLKQWQEINFCKWNGPGKVHIWIRQDLKTKTLKVFLEDNTVVQSIQY